MRESLQVAQDKIKEAIAEIDQEQTELRGALASINSLPSVNDASAAPTPAKRRGRRKRTRKGKRASRGQRAEQFLAALAEKPGSTVTEIAKKLGVERTALYPVAKRLHSEKQITKKGSGYSVKA
jgi:DNA-binding NtrC family response regulator